MAILPAGFALPPLPYLLALLVGLAAVGWLLVRRRPAVTERTVLALVPWIGLGSALHVLYVVEALPAAVRPLAGTPSVYLTVATVAGATWLAVDRGEAARTARRLGIVGGLAVLPAVAATLAVGADRGSLALAPVLGILVVAAVVTAATWVLVRRARPGVSVTGRVGLLAIAAHALDGVSTAVGVDLLGFGERTPLSRLVIEFAAGLPTAPLVGSGWLFVLVKLAVAGAVVVALAETVREAPTEGRLLLGFVAAVGLGPGVHNLLLFAVVG
ncbi:DUF63 family protein [Haloplanus salilacus]|uniref:DUF63 family protein n=1 Tax=Haloplanus salilacus TaxID=2949994 RepID=UPI0030CDA891